MELIAAMESILPVKTLLKFYKAFRAADPAHALVQVRAPWSHRAWPLARVGVCLRRMMLSL